MTLVSDIVPTVNTADNKWWLKHHANNMTELDSHHSTDTKTHKETSRPTTLLYLRTAVAQWLRCCATNRKVAGSIPDGFIGIFHWHNPFDRTMALGSTQPLTEMSTRSISRGKGCRCVRLTTLPPSCAVVMKSGNLNFLESSGPLQACNGTDLPFFIILFASSNSFRRKLVIWRRTR